MANPSLTAYPVSTTDDGIVGGGSNTSWALARSASGGTANNSSNSSYMGYGSNNAGDANTYYIYRAFLGRFDLSSIPAGSVIQSATLSVYSTAGAAYTSGGGTTANNSSVLVAGTQASTLTTADFGAIGSTELASRIAYSSFSSTGYKDYTLNAAGLAYLQAAIGSTAKFAAICGYDFDNTAPANTGYSGGIAYFSDQSGTANDPKLVVTYSTVRTTSDTWAWRDGTARGLTPSGGAATWTATTGDTWAWSDTAALYARSTAEVTVQSQGANTTLNQAGGVVGSTITVADTTGFPSSGTVWIIDNSKDTQQQAFATYTGKTGTTFTGCSWTSVIGRTTYADGSLNFDNGVGVCAPDAESHFPQITALDNSTTPVLMCSYQQHAGHAALRGSLAFKKSTDGGASWGTQQYIRSSPANGSAFGIFGHTMCRLKNNRLLAMWYEHRLDYGVADSIAQFYLMLSYSDDSGTTWSSPVRVPANMGYSSYDGTCGFGSMLYTGAGSNSTYGDVYVPITGNPDGIQIHGSGEPYRWQTWLYKITDGGAAGTMTKVAEVFTPANAGGHAMGEGDLTIAENGNWIMQSRGEAKLGESALYDRNRWQSVSTDGGVTWGTPSMVIASFSNAAEVTKLPGGTLISTGGPVGAGEANTASVLSHDNGVTWTRSLKYEATDATYYVYNGADTEVVINDSSVLVNTAFTYSQERDSQTAARTRFRWYTDPVKRSGDSWAWSDTAAGRITAQARTATDTWAWSDAAARQITYLRTNITGLGADSWAWSDVAIQGAVSSYSRTSSDTWTWSDTATQSTSGPATRTTADAWAWSDSLARSLASSRTTSDLWRWVEPTATSAAPRFWLNARRRTMSAPVKTYVQVLPKGTTRTSSYTSPTYEAKTEAGILVVLDVTSASGTGGLTLRINAHDQASSQAVPLNSAPTAITATGTSSYALYPFGAVAGNVTQATEFYLPRMFSITVTHGDSSSYAYSLGYCLLP